MDIPGAVANANVLVVAGGGQGGWTLGGGGGGGSYVDGTTGGSGGSGVVIVRYPYDSGNFLVALDSPANGQSFGSTLPISATTSFYSGTAPYVVKFYLDSTLVLTTPAATSPLTVNLGVLPVGSHTLYTTATDNTSALVTSATHTFTVVLDTTAPTPDPMTFAVTPAAETLTSVVMTAAVATDALTPPVQYYFENTTNSTNSGWQSSTFWTNTGLTTGTSYSYQVKARDGALNETAFSATASVTPSNEPVTWDANGGDAGQTDGTGNWLGANQWWNGASNAVWNNSIPNDAIIGVGGTGGAITLGTVNAGSVTFANFAGTYTLTGGGLTLNTGLIVSATAGSVSISTPIGGAGGITKAGTGTLTLGGVNAYGGSTIINGGTVSLGVPTAIGTGPISVNGSSTLRLPRGTTTGDLTLNGGTLGLASGWGDIVFSGTLALAANSTFECEDFPSTINAPVTGVGGLTKTAAGILKFTSTSIDYSGPTVVSAGLLQVAALYGNNPAQWTPANITVASGATLVASLGGAGEFTGAQVGTLFSNLTTVDNNGLKNGSYVGFAASNAGATVQTVSAILTDSTGTGGGVVGLKKEGGGTLELSGANTYTGKTLMNGVRNLDGGTLKISSFNSVATNAGLGTVHSASSSLGAPTTVENGTIQIGMPNFSDGTLVYTGTGETTDRVINFANGWWGNLTLDQSGTGLLKFTSPIAITNGGVKSMSLKGSTAGSAEIGGIPNGSSMTLNKSGTGTWILSGTNAHPGTTSINEGSLLINGTSSGTGAVNVADGAALGGTGTIAGATTVANNGRLAFTLRTVAASHNKLEISNTLAFAGDSVLDITTSGSPAPGIYTLVTASGGITGSAPALNLPLGWEATVSISGNDLLLDVTVTGTGANYSDWATTNASGQTPDQDYDNDGVENGLEYFMGQTGSSFTAMPGLDGTKTVTWTKDAAYNGNWQVQTSPNLSTWTNVVGTDNGISVSYTLATGAGKLFVRLFVTPAP